MYLAFRFGYLWVLLHTSRLASKNMFLIMSYTHNKVVSALNGNEAYRVTPTGGCFGSLVYSAERNDRSDPPAAAHPTDPALQLLWRPDRKPGWSTRVLQPLRSAEGQLCFMALSEQHRCLCISQPLLQSQPPSASPISARGYYSSLLQLHIFIFKHLT